MTQIRFLDTADGEAAYYVAVDEGNETVDIYDTREEAESRLRRGVADGQVEKPIVLKVARLGRTIDRDALAADGHRYTTLRWPDGKESEAWSDDEHDAAEHGHRA